MALCIVATKETAAIAAHADGRRESEPVRNAWARDAFHERGGPAPLAHQTEAARNTVSASAAAGRPIVRSRTGHTFAAARPMPSPTTMARAICHGIRRRP